MSLSLKFEEVMRYKLRMQFNQASSKLNADREASALDQ